VTDAVAPASTGLTFLLVGLDERARETFETTLRADTGRLAPTETIVVEHDDAGGIAAALERAASPFVSFVTRGLRVPSGAIDAVLAEFEVHSATDVLYTDEAVERPGVGIEPVLKPDPAPERLRNQYFWGDLVIFRTEVLRRLGGPREGFGSVTMYDLALRATREPLVVRHLAVVGAIRDEASSLGAVAEADVPAARLALEEHLAATGGGTVRSVGLDGVHDTRRAVQGEPLISIVIPTRGQFLPGGEQSYLVDAVGSIVERSSYPNYEIVVVIDDVADAGVVERITELAGDRLHLVPWTESFNFSGKINLGVLNSIGEYVLILNDDVRVLTPDWLEAMLALAQLPNAGMSGCMLYYEDDTIQHAGHHYWRGDTIHVGMNVPRGSAGPTEGYRLEREVVGITAACAMMRRSVYLEVGGMTTLLPGAFNDVDLCLKVLQQGYDILWTPHAELYHYESKTRDARVRHYEVTTAWGRWEHRMHQPGFWPYPV